MKNKKTAEAAIILAAGRGRRMHSDAPKQFMEVNGKPLIYYSLDAFQKSDADRIILVVPDEYLDFAQTGLVDRYGFSKVENIIAGGEERYDSVYAGLNVLGKSGFPADGIVLIHDGARPLVSGEIIDRTAEAALVYGAAVAAVPAKDTIRESDCDGFGVSTLDRSRLWQIQTPQTFRFDIIKDAYDKMFSSPSYRYGITDDAMAAETMLGTKVKIVEGSYTNIKVTTPEDIIIVKAFL